MLHYTFSRLLGTRNYLLVLAIRFPQSLLESGPYWLSYDALKFCCGGGGGAQLALVLIWRTGTVAFRSPTFDLVSSYYKRAAKWTFRTRSATLDTKISDWAQKSGYSQRRDFNVRSSSHIRSAGHPPMCCWQRVRARCRPARAPHGFPCSLSTSHSASYKHFSRELSSFKIVL